jgi:hypothetical protein
MSESPLWKWVTVGASLAALVSAAVALGRTVAGAPLWHAIYESAGWLGAVYVAASGATFAGMALKRRRFIVATLIAVVAVYFTWVLAHYVSLSANKIYGAAVSVVGLAMVLWSYGDAMASRFKAARKICPDCCETIKSEANVCKHCGYRFSPPVAAVRSVRVNPP